jgi:uncharacterized protein YndB with AHSA1/START domain
MSHFTVTVELPHPPASVFAFLADPRNRPLWQTSLRGVTDIDEGTPQTGMHWRDVTKVGIKPSMEITELTPYRVLTETGRWRGIAGLLRLRFVRTPQGTRLTAEGHLSGRGPFTVIAALSGRWAPQTIRKDLLRASEVLAERRTPGT